MKTVSSMSLGELAAYIQTHLKAFGIEVVLTGGSAVSIYSDSEYVSKDIDFVVEGIVQHSHISKAMEDIGYSKKGRYYYHLDSEYYVEFPGGLLSVGMQTVQEIAKMHFSTGTLRVLSPTDCVKDRLAAFYHWGDNQSLSQAIMVAKKHKIDIEDIKNWSSNEGKLNNFLEIEGRFQTKE